MSYLYKQKQSAMQFHNYTRINKSKMGFELGRKLVDIGANMILIKKSGTVY